MIFVEYGYEGLVIKQVRRYFILEIMTVRANDIRPLYRPAVDDLTTVARKTRAVSNTLVSRQQLYEDGID